MARKFQLHLYQVEQVGTVQPRWEQRRECDWAKDWG